jgi:prepilin-type N-terminal cleavage/methylation domain-containing protein
LLLKEKCVCPAPSKIHPSTIMKIQSRRRPHGFTLIELLVVISIIAVLAAAGFAAGNAAILRARKVTALASATAIESAVNNFYNEYGSMPADGSADAELQTDTGAGLAMLKVLLGMESTLNTRSIKFLSVREGKKKGSKGSNGLIYSGNSGTDIQGLYDPWGGPFKVMLDMDYDEKLAIPNTVLNGGRTLNGRRVAVWSLGAETSTSKKADDVVTWGQ